MPQAFPDRDEANRRFGKVFFSLTQSSVQVQTFRRITETVLPHAEANLQRQFLTFATEVATLPEYEDYFFDRETSLRLLGGVEGMAEQMVSNELASYQYIVDSAALVFGHSALDAAASELCWIAALASPENWQTFIGRRKVTLDKIADEGYESAFSEMLEDYLNNFERESLLKRVDRLFALCQPPEDFEGVSDFRFDHDRLLVLDERRHAIVHHDQGDSTFENVGADIEFLLQSGLHLWKMLNHKYDVRMDIRHAMRLPES